MHPHQRVRRRLGLQVLFDSSDIVDAIGFADRHGFGVLELNLGNILFGGQLARKRERRRIRAAARQSGIRLAAHALEGSSFFIPSRPALRAAVTDLKRLADQGAEAGIDRVVFHLGFEMYYSVNGRPAFPHEMFPDYFEDAVGGALAELKRYARGRTRLCIENVGGFRFAFVHRILDRLLGGSLGLCLDVGHVNTLGHRKRAELAFFRRHARHILHSHLHDNHGEHDEHLVLGRGSIDFLPWFRMLARTRALISFEVRPKEAALECLDYYRRRIEPRL